MLDKIMPHASSDALEIMDGLMMWNPDQVAYLFV
jgi:hypothetical protein